MSRTPEFEASDGIYHFRRNVYGIEHSEHDEFALLDLPAVTT